MGKRYVISGGGIVVAEETGRGAARRRADYKGGTEHEPTPVTAQAQATSGDVNEHLTRDLARVRAKFSMDAPPGEPSLKTAWMSEVPTEEYEAEFVDAVADCLGAGMSLQDALTCWDSGELVAEAEEETDGTGSDDAPAPLTAPAPPRRPSSGHRVLVR